MKKTLFLFIGILPIITMAGCSNNATQKNINLSNTSESSSKVKHDGTVQTTESSIQIEHTISNEVSQTDLAQSILSKYTDEQIEYARVWHTLGVHQNIEELNVLKIPAGTLIYPNDTTSPIYPFDTVQLRGSRLIDGIITYKSNHDGSIDTYNIPARWEDSIKEELTYEFIQSFIDNKTTVQVNTGNSDDIEKLIKIQILR